MKCKNKFFHDSELIEAKTDDAIKWMRRRLYEFYSSPNDSSQKNISFGNAINLAEALGFPVSGDEKESFDLEGNLQLCPGAVSDGITNISFHVWNKKSPNCVIEFSEIDMIIPNNNEEKHGIFLKIALPFVRWTQKHKAPMHCNPNRLHRECLALERVREVCPYSAPCPLLCGKDEVRNDDSSYLVMEYISEPYQNYKDQFNTGRLKMANVRYLGQTLAKIHCVLPPMFGGKDVLRDESLLEFLSITHYKKLRSDVLQYFENSCWRHPVTGMEFPFSDKTAKAVKKKPELLRALSRNMTNFTDPPIETATFAHLDIHVLNILARRKSSNHNGDHVVASPNPNLTDLKICDMEFSNWGPAGADAGLFVGSVSFYYMLYACQIDVNETTTIRSIIMTLWNSYKESYLKYSKARDKSEMSVFRSLYFIAHEILGWAGVWLFRFSLPHIYYPFTIVKSPYPLEDSVRNELENVTSECGKYDGLEMLREAINEFAVQILIMGFGDESDGNLSNIDSKNLSFQSADVLIVGLIETLEDARHRLKASFEKSRKHHII